VALVQDAIKTLKSEDGESALAEMQALGARMITTREAVSVVGASQARQAGDKR